MNKNTFVYFLYSKQQHDIMKNVEKTRSKKFVPGRVFTKKDGMVPYTEISLKETNGYSDTKVVAYGVIKDMKYEEPH